MPKVPEYTKSSFRSSQSNGRLKHESNVLISSAVNRLDTWNSFPQGTILDGSFLLSMAAMACDYSLILTSTTFYMTQQ